MMDAVFPERAGGDARAPDFQAAALNLEVVPSADGNNVLVAVEGSVGVAAAVLGPKQGPFAEVVLIAKPPVQLSMVSSPSMPVSV